MRTRKQIIEDRKKKGFCTCEKCVPEDIKSEEFKQFLLNAMEGK